MKTRLAIAALSINCLAAHAGGLQAEHVVTYVDGDNEQVEAGRWTQDEAGHARFEIDDWTQIMNPTERVVWSANSKRGRYSEAPLTYLVPPMGTILMGPPGSMNGPYTQEISRVDLGTAEINGVTCEGTLLVVAISALNRTSRMEIEVWRTDEFGFPFNMKSSVRTEDGEQTTELRNVVELTDAELEGRFRPDEDWREARFQIVRTNTAWSGFWPFTRGGSKVTGTPFPWPRGQPDLDR